jgi:predicted nucleic acid-binding protein
LEMRRVRVWGNTLKITSHTLVPRGMVDCLIAAVAWRTDAALLARMSISFGSRG